jgi:predicted RNA-binding protein YlqC (UPF0109 family)
MTEAIGDARALVEHIAKALVDEPDQVAVTAAENGRETVLELKVAEGDVGKVIGKHGRTARAMRSVVGAAGVKLGKQFAVEILE